MDTNIVKEFWEDRFRRRQFSWVDLHKDNVDIAMRLSYPTGDVLSLGCGDCSVESHLAVHGRNVTGVDMVDPPNNPIGVVARVTQDIRQFSADHKFFTVMMFGVGNFFDDKDLGLVYKIARKHTREDGIFIVKHQSAFKDRIEVDTSLDGKRYQAIYRTVVEDMQALEAVFDRVECERAYPRRPRRHDNSDFYLYKAWKSA